MNHIGRVGEHLTAHLLENKNFKVHALNYACSFGEIDVIASKNECLYIYEVKTRKKPFRLHSELIPPYKLVKLQRTAGYYQFTKKRRYKGTIFALSLVTYTTVNAHASFDIKRMNLSV